jgi:hypothetical protein
MKFPDLPTSHSSLCSLSVYNLRMLVREEEGILVENQPNMVTTGGRTWPASLKFLEFLSNFPPFVELILEKKRSENHDVLNVLELGSGCGWLGISLAQKYKNSIRVCLTEREYGGGFSWLERNVALNRDKVPNVSVEALDWAEPEKSKVFSQNWDLVIGCELVYSQEGAIFLSSCVDKLLNRNNKGQRSGSSTSCYCLLAHSLGRFDTIDVDFLSNFCTFKYGLKVARVDGDFGENGAGVPTEQTLYASSDWQLFREQEFSVFKIAPK